MPYKEFKVEKLYYTIGEVADILKENTSLVRFWSDKFSNFIDPKRNKKGNRQYTPDDVRVLKRIHYLVKDCGMTLDGAHASLKNDGGNVEVKAVVVGRLKSIKEDLIKIREGLA